MKKESNLFELIHNNVYDSNDVLIRGAKNYFINFINNFSRYCVYLINHTHELFDKIKMYKVEVENQLKITKIKSTISNKYGKYVFRNE